MGTTWALCFVDPIKAEVDEPTAEQMGTVNKDMREVKEDCGLL